MLTEIMADIIAQQRQVQCDQVRKEMCPLFVKQQPVQRVILKPA